MATTNKDNKAGTVEKNDASLEIQELKDMMKAKDAENEELRNMIKQLSDIVKATNTNVASTSKNEQFDDELVYINNNSIGSQIVTIDRLGNTSLKILPNEKGEIDSLVVKVYFNKKELLSPHPYVIELERCLNVIPDWEYHHINGSRRWLEFVFLISQQKNKSQPKGDTLNKR